MQSLVFGVVLSVALLAIAGSSSKSERNYELVGCHRIADHKHKGIRAKLGGIAANPDSCGRLCSGLGYRYFALKPANTSKHLCWCVRQRHAARRQALERLEKPEGKRARCKYHGDVFLFRLKDSFSSLGCFSYNLTTDGLKGSQRSLRACPALCSRHCRRFSHFGLSGGDHCWCIGARLHESRASRRDTCSQVCPGDRRLFCGSDSDRSLASVYRVLH